VTLGAETVSAVPLPSVATWPLPDHLEDRRAPPTSLVETLTRLAALDVPWAPHWRESFALSAEDGLGQWATTLGWRLSPEERLQLFDAPGRIAAVLEDNLAGMLAGLLGTD
jgi:hypothetical protein